MKKIVWTVGIILMIMAAVTVASATGGAKSPDAGDANKGKVDSKAAKSFAGTNIAGQASSAVYWSLPQFAWGRYGPISQSCCNSAYYRIFYGGYFTRYPAVTDTLNVWYPYNSNAVYSLGDDTGYTYLNSFDARLRTWYGDLSNAYIDWQAIG